MAKMTMVQALNLALQQEMERWREQAVGSHFHGQPAWIDYGDELAAALAGLVGAQAAEVTVMNTLTVNLHLLMVSFYRPSGRRRGDRALAGR